MSLAQSERGRAASNGPTPIVGLAISIAILAVLRSAARQVFHRLMDEVGRDHRFAPRRLSERRR